MRFFSRPSTSNRPDLGLETHCNITENTRAHKYRRLAFKSLTLKPQQRTRGHLLEQKRRQASSRLKYIAKDRRVSDVGLVFRAPLPLNPERLPRTSTHHLEARYHPRNWRCRRRDTWVQRHNRALGLAFRLSSMVAIAKSKRSHDS
jgi:hypothetical protein